MCKQRWALSRSRFTLRIYLPQNRGFLPPTSTTLAVSVGRCWLVLFWFLFPVPTGHPPSRPIPLVYQSMASPFTAPRWRKVISSDISIKCLFLQGVLKSLCKTVANYCRKAEMIFSRKKKSFCQFELVSVLAWELKAFREVETSVT